MINNAGQCCGRKPVVYKGRMSHRGLFCGRCCRHYDFDSREQIENWAWKRNGAVFVPTYPHSDYVEHAQRGHCGAA
jgi:hypothetical protein